MIRKPAVAGQFYPADEEQLRAAIEEYSPEAEEKVSALGALCPHAGYPFCGNIAGEVFAGINIPDTVLILNPSHSYFKPPLALWNGRGWETPLGMAPLHAELTTELAELEMVAEDNRPHAPEHSGEVLLPFLQYHRPDVKIAVICMAASASNLSMAEFGRQIASCLEKVNEEDALVVASSDMSHEQGADALDTVNQNDPQAIEQMEKLEIEEFLRACSEQEISMCGTLPAAAMMESVKARGGTQGQLTGRATSADSPHGRGDYVVGYAGMIFR